jgi:hypothetical protein
MISSLVTDGEGNLYVSQSIGGFEGISKFDKQGKKIESIDQSKTLTEIQHSPDKFYQQLYVSNNQLFGFSPGNQISYILGKTDEPLADKSVWESFKGKKMSNGVTYFMDLDEQQHHILKEVGLDGKISTVSLPLSENNAGVEPIFVDQEGYLYVVSYEYEDPSNSIKVNPIHTFVRKFKDNVEVSVIPIPDTANSYIGNDVVVSPNGDLYTLNIMKNNFFIERFSLQASVVNKIPLVWIFLSGNCKLRTSRHCGI